MRRKPLWITTFLVVAILFGAVFWYLKLRESTRPEGNPGDPELAIAFIKTLEQDPGYRLGMRDLAERQVARQHIDPHALLRGCIKLLHHGTPDQRRKAARLMGRLGNLSATEPLVEVLEDPDEDLRVTICFALQWLHAEDRRAQSALLRLCGDDPSVDVRVAAALALQGSNEAIAVEAYRQGLQFTSKGWIREICEDELETRGKLELPLSGDVYTKLSYEDYQRIKGSPRWYRVQREIERDGILYFEAVEVVPHAPGVRNWYRTNLSRSEK
jgi:hypothetical protein